MKKILLKRKGKKICPITQYDYRGMYISTYQTVKDVVEDFGIRTANVEDAVRGRNNGLILKTDSYFRKANIIREDALILEIDASDIVVDYANDVLNYH